MICNKYDVQSARGPDAQNHAAVHRDVQETIRPLANISYAPFHFFKQSFFFHHFISFQDQPVQMGQCECALEQASFPFREGITGIENHAAGTNGWLIVVNGLFHACLFRDSLSYRGTAVIHAVRDDRPAVIFTGPDQVEIIDPIWSIVTNPQIPREWLKSQA